MRCQSPHVQRQAGTKGLCAGSKSLASGYQNASITTKQTRCTWNNQSKIQTEQETTNGCWPTGHLHCTEIAALALTPGRPVGSKKRPPVFNQPFDASRVRAGSETILAIGLTKKWALRISAKGHVDAVTILPHPLGRGLATNTARSIKTPCTVIC